MDGDPTVPAARERPRWLTPGVAGIGAASFFSDAGHEMVTSLLPGFVTAILGGGPAALAAIDGVADALTGLSKLAGGPLASDPRRRGRLAGGGYLGTAFATAAIGLTGAIWQVAVLRALAWVSRGLRSPARDLVLVDLTRRERLGHAIGLERAGDNLGAILGPLLASALVGALGVRQTILLSLVPGVLAAAAITIAVREARGFVASTTGRPALRLHLRALRRAGLARLLAPVGCFELGNLAATLLILRATDMLIADGRAPADAASMAILLYAGHNASAAVAAFLAGALTDRRDDPTLTFGLGAAAYVAAYGLFGLGGGTVAAAGGFVLAGLGIGMAETAESALVALRMPASLRGNAFGVLGLTQSAGDIGATVVAGVLWWAFSPQVAFGYATAWMLASLLAIRLVPAASGAQE
nr:MFS transporter [Propionicimonas sp.]